MWRIHPKISVGWAENHRLEIDQDDLELVNNDENLLKKFITGDELWVYDYDPETKHLSSQRNHAFSPRPKKK